MNHFLANEWDRARTEKRGGKIQFISIDEDSLESRFVREDVPDVGAERAFDRRWAVTLLHTAMTRLQAETSAADSYRELVTEEVTRTVTDPAEAEEELRRLFAAMQ
jgi:hypothetical protein